MTSNLQLPQRGDEQAINRCPERMVQIEEACLHAQLRQASGSLLSVDGAHEAAERCSLRVGCHVVLGGQLQQLRALLPRCLCSSCCQAPWLLSLCPSHPPAALQQQS